jgi:outer membrane protein OmpA-like peptidoglycan-associated protein
MAAVAALGACSSAKPQYAAGSIDPEYWVEKVDQFGIIGDGSLSMADKHHKMRKIEIAQALLDSMNQTIPDLSYKGALRSFGRGECGTKGNTVLLVDLKQFSQDSFAGPIDGFECANGQSPLNKALDGVAGDVTSTSVPSAVVIVSDGRHMGKKDIQAAESLASKFGDNLAIYAVQVGNDRRGGKLLQNVVDAGNGGYVVNADDLTDAAAMEKFVQDVLLYPDSDGDGVPDHLDKCPDTPKGVKVDAQGCPLDSDGDGVPDYLDKCPNTPKGVKVDATGCPIDSDGDGVPDYLDKCPNTPKGVKVDSDGCPLDSDGDGVPDYLDKCPGTPRGVPVDETGCPIAGITVMGDEWMVRGEVLFALNKAKLTDQAKEVLGRAATFLKENPTFRVEIQGHTDSTGPLAWNMQLSKMRAESVKAFMVESGVAEERLTTKGFGPHEPIAPNDTAENRAKNRRVDFRPWEK